MIDTIKPPDDEDKKHERQVTITVPDEIFVDFLLKLKHEDIHIRRFFRLVTAGYASDDKRISSFIDEEMAKRRPKYKTALLQKEKKLVESTNRKFGLSPDEIDDIYDIIEEDIDI